MSFSVNAFQTDAFQNVGFPLVPIPVKSSAPDIRLIQKQHFPDYSIDWVLLDDGTLDDTQALATAVILALGTDGLANEIDILPDPDSTDRAGWWGDFEADQIWDGWPIGCRLWLLRRSKIVGATTRGPSTVALVQQYIREAIQPFIDRRIASRMQVDASRVDVNRIDALVRIYRGPKAAIDLRFAILWDEIGPIAVSWLGT
jgi:phage gp46-like protein